MKIVRSDPDQRKNNDSANDKPWRKYAPPVNREPSDPNYPSAPFDFDQWMKSSVKSKENVEESDEIPKIGDTIRTKKMQMEGKVEKIGKNKAGYDEIFFRVADDRLMKTPLSNVIVIEKLADEDNEIMEDEELNEISNEVLARYKKAAGKSASEADKKGDYKTGNKRFSGVVKATNKQFANDTKKNVKEGGMGGINRCAPAQDVSYEKVLDELPDETYESRLSKFVDEDITPWGGYTKDHKKANALSKAPKSSMQGSNDIRFSDLVKDTIDTHGLKWAFEFYVIKHGLPPKQFQIFAGLTPNLPAKPRVKDDWTDPSRTKRPEKKTWWSKLFSKFNE